jgi:hypothetical protein
MVNVYEVNYNQVSGLNRVVYVNGAFSFRFLDLSAYGSAGILCYFYVFGLWYHYDIPCLAPTFSPQRFR